jgi:hypothetical protein
MRHVRARLCWRLPAVSPLLGSHASAKQTQQLRLLFCCLLTCHAHVSPYEYVLLLFIHFCRRRNKRDQEEKKERKKERRIRKLPCSLLCDLISSTSFFLPKFQLKNHPCKILGVTPAVALKTGPLFLISGLFLGCTPTKPSKQDPHSL